MARGTVVALLGAESTGKTSLSRALARRWREAGRDVSVVPEYLREFCDAAGRTPRVDEQAAIAAEQRRRIEAAAAAHAWVLADTTALMTAVYHRHVFGDDGLFADALAWQRGIDVTLLTGLDLPWVADGLFRDSPAIREATDALLRRELQAAGIPFQTLYGPVDIRVQQALRAIGNVLGRPLVADRPEWANGRRPWVCEKCSDPDCEHRLFTDLLKQRQHPIEP